MREMQEAAPKGRFAPASPVAAGVIGLAGLLGWELDLGVLKSVLPCSVAMQPWTAMGLVLGALALWLAASPARGARRLSAALALALAVIAGLPLIEHATGIDFGTDPLLFPERVLSQQTRPFDTPGRMTLLAAQGLAAVAAALLLAPWALGRPGRATFSLLATAGLATAGISLLGYVVDLEPFRVMLWSQVPSLHTALGIGVLAAGTLALRPEVGWVHSVAEFGRAGWAAAGLLGGAVLLLAYGAQATLQAGTEAYDAARTGQQLEALFSTLKDAETGQRGYLLTGDEGYLQPYQAARARLPGVLAGIDEGPLEQPSAALARLRTLSDAKMAELAQTIALRRSGDEAAALAVVQSSRGKVIMDEIRATADTLTAAAAAAGVAASSQELRAGALAGLGGFGLVGLAFWAVGAAAAARRAAAERAVAAAQALGAAEAEARESERRLRAMQMELAHANRVATMGQLTASIAHEVRQPIAATVTNAQAAQRWLGAQQLEEVEQGLARIVRDGNRAGDIIGWIVGLIEKAPPRRDALAINEAILEVITLVHGEVVKHGVSVRTQLAAGLPLVRGDRAQLQQVIVNLVVNAIEAMGGVSEGARELLVRTGTAPQGGVLVAVQDTGPGLDPAQLDRLFEAFYTTKPGGLGMGLSICRWIIEAHDGRLWAEANEPKGAVFQFILPQDVRDAGT
jgi:signal transduction histidine kinase